MFLGFLFFFFTFFGKAHYRIRKRVLLSPVPITWVGREQIKKTTTTTTTKIVCWEKRKEILAKKRNFLVGKKEKEELEPGRYVMDIVLAFFFFHTHTHTFSLSLSVVVW